MPNIPSIITTLAIILYTISSNYSYGQVWNKVTSAFQKNTNNGLNTEDIAQIKQDIAYLCSPATLGRKSGSKGEEVAGVYIEKRMGRLGLKPLINNNYRQHYRFESDKKLSKDCKMTIGNNYLFIPEDAVPMAFSNIDAIEDNFMMPLSEEPNSPWVVPLYKNAQDAKNIDFDWEEAAYLIALKAQKKGASSVILYDEYGASNKPTFKQSSAYDPLKILVVIIQKPAYEKYVKGIKTITHINIKIEFTAEKLIGTNIVGYIDNNATKTIIIGAHYDHLGENKFTQRANTAYYPGADNNASGVASMLALASKIKNANHKNFNYVFVAFSSYENGMMGSKAFLKNLNIPIQNIACMISIDRVGLLKNSEKFQIEGLGSAMAWNELIQSIPTPTNIGITQQNKITINSEHIDFYANNIPAILVTTGKHESHGTMNDYPNKLHYDGITLVSNYVLQMVEKINSSNTSFTFQKIRNQHTDKVTTMP
jgi:aminopeptidase YwaD